MRETFTSGCASSEGGRVQRELVPPREKPEPCSLDGREEGNRTSEAHRQRHRQDGGELPGRSAREHSGGPESEAPRRPSPHPEGEGSMRNRTLAETSPHSGGVGVTAR